MVKVVGTIRCSRKSKYHGKGHWGKIWRLLLLSVAHLLQGLPQLVSLCIGVLVLAQVGLRVGVGGGDIRVLSVTVIEK